MMNRADFHTHPWLKDSHLPALPLAISTLSPFLSLSQLYTTTVHYMQWNQR